ncbi:MAG: hypothetical protein M3Y54_10030 [Bacteroidota bacterium]|nr:hypothetical protein [Bacteroidota bacterium]
MFAPSFRRFPWLPSILQRGGAGLGLLWLGLALPLAAQPAREGMRRRARLPGNAGAAMTLDTLSARPTLYAVGVAEGGGEILVLGNVALTTRHRPDGATETTTGFHGRAVWLLRSQVRRWSEPVAVPPTVTTPVLLARFVQEAAARAGLSLRQLVPFRLVGEPAAVWWHVPAFPTAHPRDQAAADLGAHGRFAQQPLDVVGFLLPPARRTQPPCLHLHARPGTAPFTAHVDSLRPGTGLRLFLPALPQ